MFICTYTGAVTDLKKKCGVMINTRFKTIVTSEKKVGKGIGVKSIWA